MDKVDLGNIKKELKKIPRHVALKLLAWAKDVETYGLKKVKEVPGYHDEPLRGKRKGQRSIRLSKAYRAIYITSKDETITIVLVQEVNKHEY